MTFVKFKKAGTLFIIRFPYDPAVVETLKASVPSWAREWKPNTKEWLVEEIYARTLAEELQGAGCKVFGINNGPPLDFKNRGTEASSRWAHTLLNRVSPECRQSIYRALSKCLHPDVGGDVVLQRELNDAFSQFK